MRGCDEFAGPNDRGQAIVRVLSCQYAGTAVSIVRLHSSMPPRIDHTFVKPWPLKYAATSSERTPLLQWNTILVSFGRLMYLPGLS